jgi:hypothetical protein
MPRFSKIAKAVLELLENWDLYGYNVARFDLRLIANELQREGMAFISKGNYKGMLARDIAASKPDYVECISPQDFFDDTKAIVSEMVNQVCEGLV